jgi:hypothetical protein
MAHFFQRFFTSRGELPAEVYAAKIRKEGRVAKEMNTIRFAAADFRRSARKALGKRDITKAEADRREKLRLARGRRGGDDCVYIFELNARHDLDGRTRRNVARLINHSCAPNCRAETIRGRIWIIAQREIPPGEELTFDYGFALKEWRLHPCRCGSPKCAGYIVSGWQRCRLRRLVREARALEKRTAIN